MDWITTTNGIITLITGFIGLLSTGTGVFFAIKNFLSLAKEKTFAENWKTIMKLADIAMAEAEKSIAKGADKKEMVVSIVKANCKELGIKVDDFIDQLMAYIDETISFVNKLTKK